VHLISPHRVYPYNADVSVGHDVTTIRYGLHMPCDAEGVG
jgi:hypothetical protein